jgi:hypothetical protein
MKTPALILMPILIFALGACSSDPEDLPDGQSNDKTTQGKEFAEGKGSGQQGLPPGPMDGSGGPLDIPMADINDLNSTSFGVTWLDPENWVDGKIPGPVFKLELSTDADFEKILFSKTYVDEYIAFFEGLAPATVHYVRISAMPATEDDRYLPSQPLVISLATNLDAGSYGGIIIKPDFGSVSFEWPKVKSSGLIDYSLQIYEDFETKILIKELVTRETSFNDFPLISEKTYWLRFRYGPAADNVEDIASTPFVTQFRVPGNELDSPENLAALIAGEDVRVSWNPTANNLGSIEYSLKVFVGEAKSELYGDFHINTPFRVLEDSQAYGSFNFELKVVPQDGNTKDIESQITSLPFDMPVTSFDPPLNPTLVISRDEPTMLTATWHPPENVNETLRYEIEIAEDGNFTSGMDQRIENHEVLTGDFTSRELGKTYYLRIRTLGSEGDATQLPSVWTETITCSMPAPQAAVEFNATDEKASLP